MDRASVSSAFLRTVALLATIEMCIRDRWKRAGYRVVLLSASRTRGGRLARDLQDEGLNAFYSEDADRILNPGEILVVYGNARRGFEYPMQKFVLITETDIFGKEQKKKKKKPRYSGQKIQSFAELSVGDYVVHENHGLGVYRGIEKVEMDHVVKDYIKIEMCIRDSFDGSGFSGAVRA